MSNRSPEYDRTSEPTKSDDRRKAGTDPGQPGTAAAPQTGEGNLRAAPAEKPDRSVENNASNADRDLSARHQSSVLDRPLSDSQLHAAVVQALEDNADIDDVDIEVLVNEGGVMLNGTVPSRPMLQAAERCVRSVQGVKGVTNNLSALMGGKIKFTPSAGQQPSASI